MDPIELPVVAKKKRSRNDPRCEPLVHPRIELEDAQRFATVARALGDPVRLQIVDVLHHHAGAVCVCEINDLFNLAQATVSHHLKVLRDAGIVDSEKHGVWAFYYVKREFLDQLGSWLLETPAPSAASSAAAG